MHAGVGRLGEDDARLHRRFWRLRDAIGGNGRDGLHADGPVLGGSKFKAGVRDRGCCSGVVAANEIRHYEGGRRCGWRGGEQQADIGAVDIRGAGLRRLGDNGFRRRCTVRHARHRAQVEAKFVDIETGDALRLAGDFRYRYTLRSEAVGDADSPFTADTGTGCGGLGKNVAERRGGTVKMLIDGNGQVRVDSFARGLGNIESAEIRHVDFCAVNGEMHSGNSGDERDEEQQQGDQNKLEEAKDQAPYSRVTGSSAYSIMKSIFAVFSSMAETEQYLVLERCTASSTLFGFTLPVTR